MSQASFTAPDSPGRDRPPELADTGKPSLDQVPGLAPFAAELLAEAIGMPGPDLGKMAREDRIRRLDALAGTNRAAREALATLLHPPQPAPGMESAPAPSGAAFGIP